MGENLFQALMIEGLFKRRRRIFFVLAILVTTGIGLGDMCTAVAQELFVDPTISIPSDFVFTVDIALDPFLLHLDAITFGELKALFR